MIDGGKPSKAGKFGEKSHFSFTLLWQVRIA